MIAGRAIRDREREPIPAGVKITKIKRPSKYNDKAAIEGWPFIYDWEVSINGEYRCQFEKRAASRGYHFLDSDGRAIDINKRPIPEDQDLRPWRNATEANSKAIFNWIVKTGLENGTIPTLAELAERRKEAAQRKKKMIAEQAARVVLDNKRRAGPAMHDALLIVEQWLGTKGALADECPDGQNRSIREIVSDAIGEAQNPTDPSDTL